MEDWIRRLPLEERLNLLEELWASIVEDQATLPLTAAQRAELDRRLAAFERDGDKGVDAFEAIEAIRREL